MIRKIIPKFIRKPISRLPIFKSPVWWANLSFVSQILAKQIQPLQKPVILLSMPRSGSSWAGEILGSSPSAMYLREPINKEFQKAHPQAPSDFEFSLDRVPPAYEKSARKVFSGLPRFVSSVIPFPEQWALSKRETKRVVLKDVNPFMMPWLTETYKPKIIYLLRHPVAITYSFERQGWYGKKFESRLSKETLLKKVPDFRDYTTSFWAEHGAFQGYLLNELIQWASSYPDILFVKYEDLCADPVNEYKRLYEFAQLQWDDTIEQKIIERCKPKEIDTRTYSLKRDTAYEAYKWKQEVPVEKVRELKKAYLAFNPVYYQDDWPDE